MSKIYNSITELVGNTPLVEFHRFNKNRNLEARVIGKLEYFNPAGSVKDRFALAAIEAAEEAGLLTPESTLVELTSGNTGIALASIAAAKGYPLKLIIQKQTSRERKQIVRAYGAEYELTGEILDIMEVLERLQKIADETPSAFRPNQFDNEVNPGIHKKTTGPEIYRDTDGQIDILVAAVGTGGTVSGSGEYLKSQNPDIKVVAVQPEKDSVATPETPHIREITGVHRFTDVDPAIVPPNVHNNIIDEVISVSTADAVATVRALAREEGILVGESSGSALFAALQLAKHPENKGKLIVVMLADNGERYLSSGLFEE